MVQKILFSPAAWGAGPGASLSSALIQAADSQGSNPCEAIEMLMPELDDEALLGPDGCAAHALRQASSHGPSEAAAAISGEVSRREREIFRRCSKPGSGRAPGAARR